MWTQKKADLIIYFVYTNNHTCPQV